MKLRPGTAVEPRAAGEASQQAAASPVPAAEAPAPAAKSR
jgi:hypothetical protein